MRFSPVGWLAGYVFASMAGAFVVVRIVQAIAAPFFEMASLKRSKR